MIGSDSFIRRGVKVNNMADEDYTNDLKIDLKGYDRLYLFYYSIELI